MEFLRFGSSIPGKYWGCCAADIIQDFNHDPDAKAAIQLVSGDGGGPIMRGREHLYAGKTYKEIFLNRIRIGTFNSNDMPNHAFFAILTDSQCRGPIGKKWLKLLKDEGFEFIRAVDNSVYTGRDPNRPIPAHPNYIFALFRNIQPEGIKDPFQPPKAWTDLEQRIPEAWQLCSADPGIAEAQKAYHRQVWDSRTTVLYTESELEGVPLWLAGLRSAMPCELKSVRDSKVKDATPAQNPFGKVVVAEEEPESDGDEYIDDDYDDEYV